MQACVHWTTPHSERNCTESPETKPMSTSSSDSSWHIPSALEQLLGSSTGHRNPYCKPLPVTPSSPYLFYLGGRSAVSLRGRHVFTDPSFQVSFVPSILSCSSVHMFTKKELLWWSIPASELWERAEIRSLTRLDYAQVESIIADPRLTDAIKRQQQAQETPVPLKAAFLLSFCFS